MHAPHSLYLSLGNNPTERIAAYRAQLRLRLGDDTLVRIRRCVNTGQRFGDD